MFGKSFKSISLVWRYAPGLTFLKLVQIALAAFLAPLSIYFTQRIIDTAANIFQDAASWQGLVIWLVLLMVALFFSARGGGFFNGLLLTRIWPDMKQGWN